MQTLKADGTQGMATVEMTYKEGGTPTTIVLYGCFVENDENLRDFIKKDMKQAFDRKKLKCTKYFFYTCDSKLVEKSDKITKIEYKCHRFTEPSNVKSGKLKYLSNQVFKVQKHIFLLCDSEKNLNKSKFLKDHCKTFQVLAESERLAIDSKKTYGISCVEENKPKLIPLNLKSPESQNEVFKLGPLFILENGNILVGSYEKTDNGDISTSIFGNSQESQVKKDDAVDCGKEEDQKGKAANPPKVSTAASSKSANRPSTSTSGNDELTLARNVNLHSEDQTPDIKEGTREAEERSFQVHVQGREPPNTEPLASEIMSKKKLLDKMCCKLDRKSPPTQNWEHLADELDTPRSILAKCKRKTDESPTERLFDFIKCCKRTEHLLVSKLIDILKNVQRNDAVDVIVNHIPENQRENKVSDEITDNPEIMEELIIKLDNDVKVLNNIGYKLGINSEILQEFFSPQNPVKRLFEYIYTTMPALTVEEFQKKMEEIDRMDAYKLLDGYTTTDKMKEVAPPHSELMYSICSKLNKRSAGIKNWKDFSSKLHIDYDTYNSFESEPPASPTGVLLEWLVIAKPDFTVRDLLTKLEKIGRHDVKQIIEDFFKELPRST